MRTRLLRGTAAGLAASSLLFAAACGGAAEAEEKPAPKASKAPADPKAKSLSAAQVSAARLLVGDLPTGWSNADGQDEDGDGDGTAVEGEFGRADKKSCQPMVDLLNGKVGSAATAQDGSSFEGPDAGEYGPAHVSVEVGTFAPGKAASTDKGFTDAVAACDSSFHTTMDGAQLKVHVGQLSVPNVGDAAQGARLTMAMPETDEYEGTEMTIDLAQLRYGQSLVAVMYMGSGTNDAESFGTILRKSAQKLADVTDGKIKPSTADKSRARDNEGEQRESA
ncbi:hypothetical protein ACIBUY_24425 [Streptomyces sp. NPDC050085]|uniref:hypothetical protein n=1 Tax=Streptomyces sp. NPDC050085 TaxID=3365600 RepID=UPI00379971A0